MRGIWTNVRAVPTTDLITHGEYLLDAERPLLLISFARSGNSPESVGAVNIANRRCKQAYQASSSPNPGRLGRMRRPFSMLTPR